MSRKPRLDYPGAKHHVTSRLMADLGSLDDDELRVIEGFIAQTVDRFPVVLHAYTLMPNHFHLVIQTVEAVLSDFMKILKQRIAQFLNRRRRRRGPVFDARFHNTVVEDVDYWRRLLAYVHLNPVGCLVDDPAGWPWSSHRAYAGMESTPPWLTTDDLIASFGSREVLLRFVSDRLCERRARCDASTVDPPDPGGCSPGGSQSS